MRCIQVSRKKDGPTQIFPDWRVFWEHVLALESHDDPYCSHCQRDGDFEVNWEFGMAGFWVERFDIHAENIGEKVPREENGR